MPGSTFWASFGDDAVWDTLLVSVVVHYISPPEAVVPGTILSVDFVFMWGRHSFTNSGCVVARSLTLGTNFRREHTLHL